jgi:peptidoglycan hydrolase CwlO-like protein
MPSGPDPDTLARIDQLAAQVAVVDALSGQLSQLNARVSAQAEFGAQLTSLRDRINELQSDTDTRREAALAATGDAELRDRLNALSDRLAATESLSGQLGQLAERMSATDAANRQTVAQVAALEQRVDSVGTELANQLSELGRDIDGLAARTSEVAAGNVTDEVVDALRTGQIKLANEQARYEIAFREDLAALAEHVRRQPKS